MVQQHANRCPVMLVAGEASGEMYAAELVEALRRRGGDSLDFFGCGGTQMRKAGVETVVDIHKLAVLGPVEAVSHLWHLYSALRLLVKEASLRRPVLAILLDFPDFNLRLAKRLKAMGIPVVYFISPQVWAWRSGRVPLMKKLIHRMLVILPFEKDFYARYGMEVDYVGHPLVDRVRTSCDREDFFQRHQLRLDWPAISLLPGSRTKEIKYHLPVLLEAAHRLYAHEPFQFLLPVASSVRRTLIEKIHQEVARALPLKLIEGETYNAVAHSDLAIVASGTATLEVALLGTPLIAVFRLSDLTWIAGQYLVDVPFYSLVNLIAGKAVIPELYQREFNVSRLCEEVQKYMHNPRLRESAKMELAAVRAKLGEGGAIERAAEKVWQSLSKSEA